MSLVAAATLVGAVFYSRQTTSAQVANCRDPIQQPFAANSIWNTPIGSGAQFVPANFRLPDNGYGPEENVIIMTPDAPLKTIQTMSGGGWGGGQQGRCNLDGGSLWGGKQLPVPDSLVTLNVLGGGTPNASSAILDRDGETLYSSQPFTICAPGGAAISKYDYGQDNIKTGNGILGAQGGSGMSSLGGAIRISEMRAGYRIPHALKLVIYGIENISRSGNGYRWPAVKADSGWNDPCTEGSNAYCGNNPALRMGALLALPPSVDINSLGLQAESSKMVARAMQEYGGYVVDNSAYSYNHIALEWGPAGSGPEKFATIGGFNRADLDKIFSRLAVVDNNGPGSVGGGGTPTAPTAAPFCAAGQTPDPGGTGGNNPVPPGAGTDPIVVNPPPPGAGAEPVIVDPDLQYVGQSCVINDGRGGTCEYVSAPNSNSLNCQDKKGAAYRSVAGVCPGSANMQCCVAPPTAILGQAGYLAFAKYAIDCTNGVSVTAAYQAGDDPTKPPIYYNIELVDGPEQAGIGRGTLIAQDVSINQGTFETMNPAWFANGRTIQFYIYTIAENTNPPFDYTIHGLDAIGALLARSPDETPPAPFTLTCPATPQPPEPPPIVPPVDVGDGGVEKDVSLTLRLFMPLAPPGAVNQTPALTTIQTAVTIKNLAINGDDGTQIVDMKYLNNGVWEGTYVGRHIPGSGFSISVKPLNHAKKTFCHSGTTSAQATYSNYECEINEGTVTVSAGRSILDFSKIPLGAGDLVIDGRSDSVVDSQDLLAILFAIARRSPYSVKYDANLDGTISQEDFELALWSMLNVSR